MSHPALDSSSVPRASCSGCRGRLRTAVRNVTARRLYVQRLATLAAVLALPLGSAACGRESHPTNVDSEAEYVDAGPLTYQVQVSRQLNPFSAEDRQYLASVPAAQQQLSSTQLWFGVFVWAKNLTHKSHITTKSFDIVDTQGNKYYPVALNAQVNPFAWTQQTLQPLATEPAVDSAASFGPTQGAELLFKLSTSVFDNRPLTLEIYAPGQSSPSTVSLDL